MTDLDADKNTCYKCIELKNQLNIERQEVQMLSDALKMEKEHFAKELEIEKKVSQAYGNILKEKNKNVVPEDKVVTDKQASIKKKNEELMTYISVLENENASYLSQIEQLESKVGRLDTQLKSTLKQNADLTKSVESYENEIKDVKIDYEKKIDSQKDDIDRLNSLLSEQEEKVNRMSDVNACLSRISLNSSAAGGCVSCANLIETNKRLGELVEIGRHQECEQTNKIQELNNLVSSLTEEKNKLKEDQRNLENKCDRYFDAKFSLQEKLKDEQLMVEELRQKLDKQADTILVLQSHKDIGDDEEKKIKANMENTINLLKLRAREDRVCFDGKVKDLNAEIRQHKETIKQLNNQIQQLTDADSHSKSSKAKMTKHVHYLESQVRSLKEECSSHITECSDLRKQKTDLLDQLYLTENKCDELECERKEFETLVGSLRREIFKLEETNKQQAKLIDFLRGGVTCTPIEKKPKKTTLTSMLKSTPRLPDSRDAFRSNRAVSHSDLFVPETSTSERTVTLDTAKRLF